MRDLKQWFLASWWCLRWLNASSRRKMSYKNNLDGWLQEWYKLYDTSCIVIHIYIILEMYGSNPDEPLLMWVNFSMKRLYIDDSVTKAIEQDKRVK